MRVRVVDAAPLDAETVRRTRDGYLVADAKIARIGIQNYSARELGLTDRAPGDVIRVYRGEGEVFNTDSMATLAHRPVTVDHPPEMVTAANWSKYAVGDTGGDVARDGDYIRVPLKVMDQRGIDAIEGGKRELSVGYFCDLDFTPGTTPQGEAFDARQTSIVGNHLAICTRARAGSTCRIGDSWEPRDDAPLLGDRNMELRKVMVDGLSVETTDAGATAIAKLLGDIATARTEKVTVDGQVAELTTLNATKDAEIATLKTQLADAALTPAKLQDAAKAYALVVGQAKALGATVTDGMDIPAIQAAVVNAKLGDAAKGWTADQIATSFATLAAGVKVSTSDVNPLALAIIDGAGEVIGDKAAVAAKEARDAYLAHIRGEDTKAA